MRKTSATSRCTSRRLAWGMKKNIELVQPPDNMMPFKWVVVK